MTPDTRREILEQHGFSVARRSFAGHNGQRLYYVLQLLPDGTRGNATKAELDGRQCSIDLATGVWNQWGSGIDQPFEAGPWWDGETAAIDVVVTDPSTLTESPSVSGPQGSGFFASCVAAGFVLDDSPAEVILPNVINRWAWYGGRKWLLVDQGASVRSVVGVSDGLLTSFKLTEFLEQYETRPAVDFIEAFEKLAEISEERTTDVDQNEFVRDPLNDQCEQPLRRPFVSMKERPVSFSGKKKQHCLFRIDE